jgi:RNA ligase (TIGR02306 family)
MRKLASIKRIDSIRPIPNADAIDCAVLGGWAVVTKKGEFAAGDLAVYCEIDSWIPHELAPFLSKGQEPHEYDGIRGERLRTVKLRGQISQGLLLPIETGGSLHAIEWKCLGKSLAIDSLDGNLDIEGMDVSEILGIVKYNPPIPAHLSGDVKGLFPSFISKTDQERVQNLTEEYAVWLNDNSEWEVTEKLDGCSMTAYIGDSEFRICSRNLELRRNERNSLWRAAVAQNLEEIIVSTGRNLALQGELVGEGIQGNPYKLKGQKFFLFDIFDIDQGRYFLPDERYELFNTNHAVKILRVPLLATNRTLPENIDEALMWAEGKSELNSSTEREGVVFKQHGKNVSFKAISNSFLLKNQ